MKLQIFTIKKLLPWILIIFLCLYFFFAVISLDSTVKKDENYYLQVFLKQCKYTEQKVIGHINDTLSDFSSSIYSDNSDEE